MTDRDMTVEELADRFRELPDSDVRTRKPRAQDDGSQDTLDVAGKAGVVDDRVRTKHQARVFAFAAVKSGRADWHGLCLKFVRECFGVEPLFPDARTAWEEADAKRRTTSDRETANAKPGFYSGGDHDHVVFLIGDGRCVSTDIDPDEPGEPKVCRVSAIESAWPGFTYRGHTDDLNGESVPAPRPRRRITDRQWRRKMLRRAIVNSRRAGNHVRTARLRRWLDSLR